MRILLINPPFTQEYAVGASKSIKHVLNVVQPLGLAYLAAVLEKAKFRPKIIDCAVYSNDKVVLREIIEDKPQIIGMTATTANFDLASQMARGLKESLPEALFILGGPHVSAVPNQAMRNSCFDVGVLNEGEETFLELVNYLAQGSWEKLDLVRGIIFRRGKDLRVTSKREFIAGLDDLPFPARHLLPGLKCYHPTPASYKKLPLATIMTSRGCPSRCVFCDRAVFGNSWRSRSAENILAEVDQVVGCFGAREIRFFDDLFTLDKKRAYKICAEMRKRKITWTCLTAVNAVDKDLLKEMRGAGCWQVLYGLESADPRMLGLLKKGNTIEQNIKAVRWAKEAGLSVRADFIVGTPGETKESLERTLRFAVDMNLDYAHFNKFVPFPGTELFRRLSNQGYDFDLDKKCSIVDHGALFYLPEGVKKEEFRRFLDASLKRFYLRPSYILKRLLSIRTKDELIGQIKGFLAITGL